MKIILASVGKPHEAYVKAGIEDFTNRIEKYFPVNWLIIPPLKNTAALNEKDLKNRKQQPYCNKYKKMIASSY